MELVKDIYFNTDKLVENTNVKVSYTGKFYQSENEKVFLHYGYGKDWNNVNDIEMKKTDLGYQAELNLGNCDTLNFCFKNQNNEWDNNFGKNYVFDIERTNAPIAESKDNVNVFWGTSINNTPAEENVPNQIDAIFGDNAISYTNEFGTVDISTKEVKTVENCVAIPVEIPNADSDCKVGFTNNNSIALAPTGFEYWTTKIKSTVLTFFSNVPKIISGNYKRLISKAKNL